MAENRGFQGKKRTCRGWSQTITLHVVFLSDKYAVFYIVGSIPTFLRSAVQNRSFRFRLSSKAVQIVRD